MAVPKVAQSSAPRTTFCRDGRERGECSPSSRRRSACRACTAHRTTVDSESTPFRRHARHPEQATSANDSQQRRPTIWHPRRVTVAERAATLTTTAVAVCARYVGRRLRRRVVTLAGCCQPHHGSTPPAAGGRPSRRRWRRRAAVLPCPAAGDTGSCVCVCVRARGAGGWRGRTGACSSCSCAEVAARAGAVAHWHRRLRCRPAAPPSAHCLQAAAAAAVTALWLLAYNNPRAFHTTRTHARPPPTTPRCAGRVVSVTETQRRLAKLPGPTNHASPTRAPATPRRRA